MAHQIYSFSMFYLVFCCLLLTPNKASAAGSYLDQAKTAYENFEFEQALSFLSKASADEHSTDRNYMASVHMYFGLVRFTLGQREQAEKEFTEALRLDYSIYPPDDTSPKILSVFRQIKSTISPPVHKNEHPPHGVEVGTGVPPAVDKSGGRVWTWVLTGVGGAALATAGVFAGLASKSKGEFDDAQWASDASGKRDEVEQRALTANVLFGVGGAAMVGALILFFVEDGQVENQQDQSALELDLGLSGFSATVRF